MKLGEAYATQVMFRSDHMDELARQCADKVEIIDHMKDEENMGHFNALPFRGLFRT